MLYPTERLFPLCCLVNNRILNIQAIVFYLHRRGLIKDLLTENRDVFNDPFKAIIRQRKWINLGLAISLVEQGLFFLRGMSVSSQTSSNKHQITFFGGKDQRIPIDHVKSVVFDFRFF
jgi:hypothetical protein